MKIQTRGEGVKNLKFLQTSYVEISLDLITVFIISHAIVVLALSAFSVEETFFSADQVPSFQVSDGHTNTEVWYMEEGLLCKVVWWLHFTPL